MSFEYQEENYKQQQKLTSKTFKQPRTTNSPSVNCAAVCISEQLLTTLIVSLQSKSSSLGGKVDASAPTEVAPRRLLPPRPPESRPPRSSTHHHHKLTARCHQHFRSTICRQRNLPSLNLRKSSCRMLRKVRSGLENGPGARFTQNPKCYL